MAQQLLSVLDRILIRDISSNQCWEPCLTHDLENLNNPSVSGAIRPRPDEGVTRVVPVKVLSVFDQTGHTVRKI